MLPKRKFMKKTPSEFEPVEFEEEEEELEEEIEVDTEVFIDVEDLVNEFGFVRIRLPPHIQVEEIITEDGKEIIAADSGDYAS